MSAYSPPTRRIPSCSSDYPQCEAKAHTLFPLPSHQIKTQNLSFLKRHRQIFSFRVLKRQILLPFAQKQTKTLSVFAVALHPEGVDRNLIHDYFFAKSLDVAFHLKGAGRTQIVTLDFWRDMPPSLRIKTKMCRASKRRNSSKSAFIGCEKRRMRAFFCR